MLRKARIILNSFLILVGLLLGLSVASAAQIELDISDVVRNKREGCAEYLKSTVNQTALPQNMGPIKLHLGHYEELAELLIKAGMTRPDSDAIALSLREVHAIVFNYESTAITAGYLDELVGRDALYICAISKKCRLSTVAQNFMSFTPQNETIIYVPPPIETRSPTFAINFLGSVASLAGERILLKWLYAGHAHLSKGKALRDPYFLRYASQFDGISIQAGSIQQEFVIIFMTLYQTLVSTDLYAIYNPEIAGLHRAYLARKTYRDLVAGHNQDITSSTVHELGITEKNILDRAEEIFVTVLQTLSTSEK